MTRRDLEGLAQLRDLPPKMLELLYSVRQKKSLQPQFWRYLDSFTSGCARGARARPTEMWTPANERRASDRIGSIALQSVD